MEVSRPSWRQLAAEVVFLVVIVALFSWLHNLAGTDAARAAANAYRLQEIESVLGLDIERSVNHYLAGYPSLAMAAVWYYRLYYLPLAGVLAWVLLRHADVYRTVRTVLAIMAALALVAFWLLPMSPPRFAMPGIVDIVAEHDVFFAGGARDLANGQNHFSAFPSMHVGWSALCAHAAWLAMHRRLPRLALLVWLYPAVMVAVVIGTGNHYVLDVAGSAALLAISITAAAVWRRYRHRPRGRDRPMEPRGHMCRSADG